MKKRSLSLAVKVGAFVVAIILILSLLLLFFSNHAYKQAVIQPYRERLAEASVPQDLAELLRRIVPFVHSEELDEIWAMGAASGDALLTWLGDQSVAGDDEADGESHQTLLTDIVTLSMSLDSTRNLLDLDELWVESEKNGFVRQVDAVYKQTWVGDFGSNFGLPGSRRELRAEDCAAPVLVSADGRDEYIRCITFEVEDSRVHLWMSYDLTDTFAEQHNFLVRSTVSVVLMLLVASALAVWVMRRGITRPVILLARATKDFVPEADGTWSPDRISQVQVNTGDEIGELCEGIRSMQERIVDNAATLSRVTAERERIKTELTMAAEIQRNSLPVNFPSRPEFELYASMTPAKEVGGDFYDFFAIDDDHLCLVIADVSGKGVPAALFMMVSQAVLRSSAMFGGSPSRILNAANESISANNSSMMFVTVWLGILEISTGRLVCANAGHERPALCRGGQGFDLYRDPHGLVIGVRKGSKYTDYELTLQPGDTIFVYTDGVPEANDDERALFGTDRMIWALNRSEGESPAEILAAVRRAVDNFVGGAEQFDDLTMLCLRYRGGSRNQQAPETAGESGAFTQ